MKVAKDGKGESVGKSRTDTSGSENGVMFPRLNVKETKTDGPRAPPRNKMALYEQFTIPSHRFVQSTNANPRQNPASTINQPVTITSPVMEVPFSSWTIQHRTLLSFEVTLGVVALAIKFVAACISLIQL